MIKLDRREPPKKLTPSFVEEKTSLYIMTGKRVWNIGWLKDSLLELSHEKCAYCECKLKVESKYMQVDHFQDKHHYPDKVLAWDNLLPSCNDCNTSKSNHDVVANPIVNPFVDNPNEHLYMEEYRFKWKDEKGKQTIQVLNLNSITRNYEVFRSGLGIEMQNTLSEALNRLRSYINEPSVGNKNSLLNIVEAIMKFCEPQHAYSAVYASVLHRVSEYKELKKGLSDCNLWTTKFKVFDKISRSICLLKDNNR